MMKREEDHGECSSQAINNFHHHHHHHHQSYQEHLFLQQMHQHNATAAAAATMFPEVSPVLQPAWTVPPVPYGAGSGFFNRSSRLVPSSFQFAYDVASNNNSSSDHLRILSDAIGPMVQPVGPGPFGLQAELGKMTAQEIMDAKALAASKSHSEAERRRRERINNHLAKLRTLLPSTTKTDKASLLAEVIEHVKELKRQTSAIAESSAVPTEGDELTVAGGADEGGKFVIKASFCCEDRSDLLPELIKTLKAMRLRTVKAEITTVGGRVKNVLFITGEDNHDNDNNIMEEYSTTSFSGSEGENQQYFISSIEEALRAVMEKSSNNNGNGNDECGSVKRQRTNMSNILQHQHQQHRSL